MIDKHELRIGNIVDLHTDTDLFTTIYIENCEDIDAYQNLHPTLITEDWLRRAGQSVHNPTEESANYKFICWIGGIKIVENKGIRVFLCMGGVCTLLEHIRYVHQIQNLYFAFYNKEIDFKF